MRRILMPILMAAGLAVMAGAGTAAARDPAGVQPQPAAWGRLAAPSQGPAQAIGGYAAGCLAGGVPLAGEGTGYQIIRMSRNRYYGHPSLIAYLEDFGRKVAAAGLGTALIADMTQPRGGPMRYGHASHQSGLDADIWLRLDLPALGRKERESLHEVRYVDYARMSVTPAWSERQARMVRIAASDRRVDRIFVNPAIKKDLCARPWPDRAWLGKVRPWHGHDGHMHIRLVCPPGSSQCVPQKALPEGDGCDEDLAWWLERAVPAREIPPEKAVPPNPKLPPSCTAVFGAKGISVAQAKPAGNYDNN
ncbi:penicillin-insensitive murein endopeptidase [Azospirillum halopraeferens]|uniref:penicillin-insensitive murein endopeptidase n=1 Tax=Azospirillum halopraeferens TaxID=34010 RepID=UPI0004058838|nr:penicillin-insensitive murein endopeptidase [Azospirillum halopraeferens]